jgi:hypothetical protein
MNRQGLIQSKSNLQSKHSNISIRFVQNAETLFLCLVTTCCDSNTESTMHKNKLEINRGCNTHCKRVTVKSIFVKLTYKLGSESDLTNHKTLKLFLFWAGKIHHRSFAVTHIYLLHHAFLLQQPYELVMHLSTMMTASRIKSVSSPAQKLQHIAFCT